MSGKKASKKLYPDSHVEIQGLLARHYDFILNTISLGFYTKFIKSTIASLNIQPGEHILDLGCGTGRNACLMYPYLNEKGNILGLDVSEEMGQQFRENCKHLKNVAFKNQRIDISFKETDAFDRIFISFVIHGFPHKVRLQILQNIVSNLKVGGRLCILDFSEFKMSDMPFHERYLFKTFECKYAFDFVERNWIQILSEQGFGNFQQRYWFKKYVRLLIAEKTR